MAPTVIKDGAFRLFFFSREESRLHVHISHADGEAKYWLEPAIVLAQNFGLSAQQLRMAEQLVKTHEHRIRTAWTNTSEVEVTHISKHGLWLLLGDRELFMAFEHFPWFRDASVGAIQDVQWPQARHLYWPQLDIDLAVESIEHPEQFPLVAKS